MFSFSIRTDYTVQCMIRLRSHLCTVCCAIFSFSYLDLSRNGMIVRSIWISFTLFTLCVLAASESNETLKETPLKRCAQVNKKLRPRFHLVRRCARSDVRIVISAYFSSVGRCIEFAMYKRGLAINFGWLKGGIGHCEVLECPEHDTLGFLRRREDFDYYSLYANPLPSTDWVCVPKVGVFRIGRGEARAVSRRKCQEWALMPSPHNKTESKKGTTPPGGYTEMTTTTSSTARLDEHFTQERFTQQPSNLPPSPALPFPTLPPPGVLPSPPVPPFPISPPFDNSPFGPPLLPPGAFPGNLEEPAFWNPEYRLGDLLSSSNATDLKPMETGRLANILSQERTTNLTTFLKSKIGNFFPPVLVGMATVPGDESLFATSDGEPLPCFRFRAWAPGHPLPIKYLDASFRKRASTPKPSNQVRNVTTKANTTASASITMQTTKNETTSNNGTTNITISAAQRKRDEMTLCVYIQRDSLWHTNRCSTRTHFLCEFLPSGGPCRDANSTDERAECEHEKIGTKQDRCSAWNDEMITTTMPPEPEKGDGDMNNADDDNKDNNGDDNNDNNVADEGNNNTDDDDNMNVGEQDNSDNDERGDNNNDDEREDNNDNDEPDDNSSNDEGADNNNDDEREDNNNNDEPDDNSSNDEGGDNNNDDERGDNNSNDEQGDNNNDDEREVNNNNDDREDNNNDEQYDKNVTEEIKYYDNKKPPEKGINNGDNKSN